MIAVSSDFDEESLPFEGDPREYALAIASGKSKALLPYYKNDIIVTADTVVYREGKVYAKPRSLEEAEEFIGELQGQWHQVITAVVVRRGNNRRSCCDETRVLFHPLTAEQIHSYCHAVSPLDKAGGYAIQGKGALIIKRIEGCYYNVMGLSLNALGELLPHFGIDLWQHL